MAWGLLLAGIGLSGGPLDGQLEPQAKDRDLAVFLLRATLGSFLDYFAMISGFERFRAGQFGIRHYCMIGLNSKEANNEALAEEVIEGLLPRYLCKEGVVALGEIGFDDITPLEERYYRRQLEMAKEVGLPVCVHTPHRNKKQGTLRSMEIALEHGLEPTQVVMSGAVRVHNRRGRAYYALIRPVHPMVVRAMLNRAASRLERTGVSAGADAVSG
jgi:hypothetical protein